MSRFIRYPYKPKDRQSLPRQGMIVSDWGRDYQLQTGWLRLNPERLGGIMRQANTGNTTAMYEMFHGVEEDPHVHSVLSKRKLAVTSRALMITPSVEETADGEVDAAGRDRALEASELCNSLVFGEAGRPGIDNLQQAMLDVCDGIGRGFSLNQIIWERDEARDLHVPVALQHWAQSHSHLGAWGAEQGVHADHIRILSEETSQPEELVYGQWIRHVHKVRSDIIARAALLRVVAWWWLFKHFSVADWSIFIERYGMPLRKGTYGPSAQDEEKRALRAAVIQLGKDGGAILPDSTAIELVEARFQGEVPHEGHARFCNEEISKAVLGQTMSTEAPERGARSLGETQRKDQVAIANDDALRVAETLRRDLLAPIVFFNLGADFPVPKAALVSEEKADALDLARRDQILTTMGLKIGVNHLYEAHEIPPPDEDEETVGGASAAPPAGQEQPEDQSPPTDEEQEEAEQQANATNAPYAVVTRACGSRVFAWDGQGWHALQDDVKKKSLAWVTPIL
jgi:phage gp29-like protein